MNPIHLYNSHITSFA